MKRMFIIGTFVAMVPLMSFGFFTNINSVAQDKSVEFGIAESSSNGLGYAMPASGNSGKAGDTPGCNLSVDRDVVNGGEDINISWRHGAVTMGSVIDTPGVGQGSFDRNLPPKTSVSTSNTTSTSSPFGLTPDFQRKSKKPVEPTSNTSQQSNNSPDQGRSGGYLSLGSKANSNFVEENANPELVGSLQGYNGAGWTSGSMTYRKGVTGKSCMAFCNIENGLCTLDDTSNWDGLIVVANGGRGGIKTAIAPEAWSDIAFFAPIALASGGKGYTCKGASAESGSTVVAVGKEGSGTSAFSNGIFKIGMKTSYTDSYGDHHNQNTIQGCYDYIAVNADNNAEMVPELPIIGTVVPFNKVTDIVGVLRNIGVASTDSVIGEDGLVEYVLRIDKGNDGTYDITHGVGSNLPPIAALSSGTFTRSLTAGELAIGTHSAELCVNPNRRFTEVAYNNNCVRGTFIVAAADLASYLYPGYALFGGLTHVNGFVINVGDTSVNPPVSSDFDVRRVGDSSSNIIVPSPAYTGAIVDSKKGYEVKSDLYDFSTNFGSARNLEYRLWADTTDSVSESVDNVRPNESGNNDSAWQRLTLVNPEISVLPADLNGSSAGYWGPYLFTSPKDIAFDVSNNTTNAVDLTIPFQSIIAIDTNNDCSDNAAHTDLCIEHRFTRNSSFIAANSAARPRATWLTNFIGDARARIYADTNDDLDETNENNNISAWIPFTMVESMPGEAVDLIPDKTAVRNGDNVTFTWNINGRQPGECRILQNFTKPLLNPLSGANLVVPIMSTSQFTLECDANAGAGYGPARDTVTITALSSYFET